MFPIDPDTDPRLRQQILTYAMSSVLSDRERARLLDLPEGCRIREGAKILCREKLQCGEQVWIGEGALLDAQGGLSIGSHTQIGLHCMIWSHTSHWQALRGETGETRKNIVYKETRIGARCFIGGPSVIMPGVTIGDRVFVAPMSVVESDLADGSVFAGPQRAVQALEKRVAELERRLAELGGATP